MCSEDASDGTEIESVREYRRRFLQGVGATGIAGIAAGCLGSDDGDENGGDGSENGDESENGGDTENGDDEPASFEVSELSADADAVTVGQSVAIGATITNTGEQEDTQSVELSVAGDAHDDVDLTLGGGEDDTVTFAEIETIDLGVGEFDYEVGTDDDGVSATLTVEQVAISTQFWTYNAANMSTVELIYEAGRYAYDAIEPYGGPGNLGDVDEVAAALDATGLEFGSTHIDQPDLTDDPESVADVYTQLGEPALIIPSSFDGLWEDESSVVDYAEQINGFADEYADYGLEVGYHNHDYEFQEIGDETAFDIFAREVEDHVHLQIDVGWVVVAGADPVDVIETYPEKIKSVHMKDMTEDGEYVEIGEGDVDMQGIADVARTEAEVDYLVYEYDDAPDPLESLEYGAEFLQNL